MDKAILGYCRIGYFRLGVYTDAFTLTVNHLKNLPTAIPEIRVDQTPQAVVDSPPYYRVDVFTLHWSQVKKNLEKVS